jgi:DNA-binding response OmpR family regulator
MSGNATIKVLLIEDDQDDARLVRDWLSESDRATFVVEAAHTAKTGLDMLQKGRFDVVMLDYRLPDADGLSVLEAINREHYQVPVIIVTSHGDRSLQGKAIELGAVEYLEKGLLTGELLERTCIYAIGLNEKKLRNGSGPGVSVLIEQLLGVTRESVRAQSENAQELRELRRELGGGLTALQKHMETSRTEATTHKDELLKAIQDKSKIKWFLRWVVEHPVASVFIFLCLILAVLLVVVAVEMFDVDKVLKLKDATGNLIPFSGKVLPAGG